MRLRFLGYPVVVILMAIVVTQLDARACFFNDPATTEIYTLSLHDALPI